MFQELVPLLRHRAVLLTLTALEEDQIRVNIVPKKVKDEDHNALTTPLSVTGTAEELDAELASTIVNFVASYLQMRNSLERAQTEMATAAMAAQAEARAKGKAPQAEKELPKPENAPPVATARPTEAPKSAAPQTGSLFDAPQADPAIDLSRFDLEEETEILDEIGNSEGVEEIDELDEAA